MKKILKSRAFTVIVVIFLALLWFYIEMGGLQGTFTPMEEKYKVRIPSGVKLEEKHLPKSSFRGDGIRLYVVSAKSNMDDTLLDKNDMKEVFTKEHTDLIRECNQYFEQKKATQIDLNHNLKHKEINVTNDTLLIIYDENLNKYFLVDSRV